MSLSSALKVVAVLGFVFLALSLKIEQVHPEVVPTSNFRILQEPAQKELDCSGEKAFLDECLQAPSIHLENDAEAIKTLNPDREQIIIVSVFASDPFDMEQKLLEPTDADFLKNFPIKQDGNKFTLVIPGQSDKINKGAKYRLEFTAKSKPKDGQQYVQRKVIEFGFLAPTVWVTWDVQPREGTALETEFQFTAEINGKPGRIPYTLEYVKRTDPDVAITIASKMDYVKAEGAQKLFITYRFPVGIESTENILLRFRYKVDVDQDEYKDYKEINLQNPPQISDDYFVQKLEEIKGKGDDQKIEAKEFVPLINSISAWFNPKTPHGAYLDVQGECDENFCGGKTMAKKVFQDYCACIYPCDAGFDGPTCQFETNKIRVLTGLYYDILAEMNKRAKLTPETVGQYTEALKAIVKSRHVFDEGLYQWVLDNLILCINEINIESQSQDQVEDIYYIIETIDVAMSTDYFAHEDEYSQPELHIEKIKAFRSALNQLLAKIMIFSPQNERVHYKMYRSGLSMEKVVPVDAPDNAYYLGFNVEQSIPAGTATAEEAVSVEYPLNLLKKHNNGNSRVIAYGEISAQNPYDLASSDELNQLTSYVNFGLYEQADKTVIPVYIPIEKEEERVNVIFTKFRKEANDKNNLFHARCGWFEENYVYNWIMDDTLCQTKITADPNSGTRIECNCALTHGKVAVLIPNEHPDRPIPCYGHENPVAQCADVPTLDLSDVELHQGKINPAIDDVLRFRAFTDTSKKTWLKASLSMKHESGNTEVNKTFFEKVKIRRIDETQLDIIFPKEQTFDYRHYVLRISIFSDNGAYLAERIQEVDIEIVAPPVKVVVSSSKTEGQGFIDTFELSFSVQTSKEGEGVPDFDYQVSLMTNAKMTLSVGRGVKKIDPLTFVFLYPRKESGEFEIIVDFMVKDLGFIGSSAIKLKSIQPKMSPADGVEKIRAISALPVEKIRLVDLLIAANSFISLVTPNDNHHTQVDFVDTDPADEDKPDQEVCGKILCNNHGKCKQYYEFTGCICEGGWTGPSCYYNPQSQDLALNALIDIINILESGVLHLNIDQNIDAATELIKVVTRNRHLFSFGLAQKATEALGNVVRIIPPNRTNDFIILEDIFFAVESMTYAVNNNYFLKFKEGADLLQHWKIIEGFRSTIRVLNDNIIHHMKDREELKFTTSLFGETINITKPGVNAKGRSGVTVRSDSSIMGLEGGQDEVYVEYSNKYLASLQTAPDKPIAIVAQITYSNPFTLITGDKWVFQSSVVNVHVLDKATGSELSALADSDTNHTRIYWTEVSTDNLFGIQCAFLDRKTSRFIVDKKVCIAKYYKSDNAECICKIGTGTFALVKENERPERLNVEDVNNPEKVTLGFKLVQILFTVLIMAGLWAGVYVASLREGLVNPQYAEDWTFQPLYSVLMVYSGTISRSVRVHLIFLTLVTQLAIATTLFSNNLLEFNGRIFALAIVISWPINYIWGFLAKFISGGLKMGSKTLFILLAQAIIVAILVYCNLKWAKLYETPLTVLVETALGAFLVDLLVVDTLVAIVARVQILQLLFAQRGFFQRESGAGAVYVRQQEQPLSSIN